MARPTRLRDKWRIRWIDENGKRRSEVYGSYEDAEFKLKQHEVEVQQVKRGLRPPTGPDRSFEDLAAYWLRVKAPAKRSARDDESIIRTHLRPFFGGLRLAEITAAMANEFKISKAHLSNKTVNNHLTLLIAMLNAARHDLTWLTEVPRIKKHRFIKFEKDFRYLKTKEEIARFLRAARAQGEMIFMLNATAVYTGMRAGELAGLHWDDVDLDRRLITVQRSYEGPTKSGDVRHVPVLEPLFPLLRKWRLRHPGRLVFTNESGRMIGQSGRPFQEVLHRVLEAAEFPLIEYKGKKDQRYVTFHGLRHTFASHWVMAGGTLFKLQKILGHKSIETTMRYAHLAPDAFAEDYELLGKDVQLGGDVRQLVEHQQPAS